MITTNFYLLIIVSTLDFWQYFSYELLGVEKLEASQTLPLRQDTNLAKKILLALIH